MVFLRSFLENPLHLTGSEIEALPEEDQQIRSSAFHTCTCLRLARIRFRLASARLDRMAVFLGDCLAGGLGLSKALIRSRPLQAVRMARRL